MGDQEGTLLAAQQASQQQGGPACTSKKVAEVIAALGKADGHGHADHADDRDEQQHRAFR